MIELAEQPLEVQKKSPDLIDMLPPDEREYITHGLGVLTKHLQSVPKDKLPKVVLFPDISARPLSYAVRPLFEKLYKANGVTIPPFMFVKVLERESIAQEKYLTATTQRTTVGDFLAPEDTDIRNSILSAQEELGNIARARTILTDRVKEVISKNDLASADTVLIIDDFVTENATAVTEIRDAFTRTQESLTNKDPKRFSIRDRLIKRKVDRIPLIEVNAFAFLCSYKIGDVKTGVLAGQRYESKTNPGSTNIFTYRMRYRDQAVGLMKDHNTLYSLPSSDADTDAMRKLREGMTELGEQFVQSNPDLFSTTVNPQLQKIDQPF